MYCSVDQYNATRNSSFSQEELAQENLSGLAVISVNHDVGGQISYDDVIDDFAARKARRIAL